MLLHFISEQGQIPCDNAKISVYLDFSIEVRKQWAQFATAKRQLCIQGLKYAMLYPVKLRVIADGKTTSFNSPQEMMD